MAYEEVSVSDIVPGSIYLAFRDFMSGKMSRRGSSWFGIFGWAFGAGIRYWWKHPLFRADFMSDDWCVHLGVFWIGGWRIGPGPNGSYQSRGVR